MSSIKRKPSRSPEGSSHQKKALRNESVSNGNDSRKNSSANASVIDASADPRQNRGAISNVVRSPVSTDGSYQDATSSRSSPRPTNLKVAVNSTTSHNEGDSDMKALLGPLETLLALTTKEARLQVSHKVAKSRQEAANAEYHKNTQMFQKFPPLEERLTRRKVQADQEVAKLEPQLKVTIDAQPSLAKSLVAAFLSISNAEEARHVPEIAPDAISRKEFKELQDQFAKQQVLLEKQQDQFAKQQDLYDEQQRRLETLQNLYARAGKAALQARDQANTTEKEIISDLNKLVNRLQETETFVRSEFLRIRKEMQPQLNDHGTAVAQMKKQFDDQRAVVSQLSNTVDAATGTVSGAQKGLTKLEERIAATKNEVDNDVRRLEESLRSKNTDIQKVCEDLALDVKKVQDAPEAATLANASGKLALAAPALDDAFVAKVEANFLAIQDELAQFKQQTKDDAETRDEVLGGAQDDLEAKTKDQLASLETKTRDQLASISVKVDGLEELVSTCSSGIQRLEQISEEKHAQSATHVLDVFNKIKGTYEALQSTTSSLSASVAALEKRPVPTAPMPAPAVAASSSTAQDGQSFRPIARQSPHAPNSRPGSISAQPNGVQSPRNATSPFGHVNSNANGAPPRDIAVLTDQVRGLSGMLNNLRQRMDNLTTEEVVHGMVDQMSQIYPAAKNFQSITDALQTAHRNIEGRLDKVSLEGNLRASKVEGAVATLRRDVEGTIGEAKKTFDTAVEAQNTIIIDVKHQVKALADAAWPEDA